MSAHAPKSSAVSSHQLSRVRPSRGHALWFAFILHRISGIALALFLPLHFWVLALALHTPDELDRFLRFADMPAVKVAEFGLVFLLAVHVFGGLRLMAMEWLPWTGRQKSLAALTVSAALFVATIFFLQAI